MEKEKRMVHQDKETQIQFLRFLAFLNIFLLHSDYWVTADYPVPNGAISAVTFFFMLSGALCGYTAEKRTYSLSVKSIALDMYQKIKKVYGLYFITTVFLVLPTQLPSLIASCQFQNSIQLWKGLIKNLLLIQSWFPTGWFNFNGVGWFLSTLMFLYLLNIPCTVLLQKLAGRPDKNRISLIGMALLFAATVVYSYFTNTEAVHFLQYIIPPARITQYVCGILLGYWIRNIKYEIQDSEKTGALFTAAEILALILWLVSVHMPEGTWSYRLVDYFVPNLFLIGVFLMGKGWLSALFRKKPFVRLGDVSFECFLLHQPIIIVFPLLTGVVAEGTWEKQVCFLACLLLTLATAFYLNGRKTR